MVPFYRTRPIIPVAEWSPERVAAVQAQTRSDYYSVQLLGLPMLGEFMGAVHPGAIGMQGNWPRYHVERGWKSQFDERLNRKVDRTEIATRELAALVGETITDTLVIVVDAFPRRMPQWTVLDQGQRDDPFCYLDGDQLGAFGSGGRSRNIPGSPAFATKLDADRRLLLEIWSGVNGMAGQGVKTVPWRSKDAVRIGAINRFERSIEINPAGGRIRMSFNGAVVVDDVMPVGSPGMIGVKLSTGIYRDETDDPMTVRIRRNLRPRAERP